jgi:hypothetical protein
VEGRASHRDSQRPLDDRFQVSGRACAASIAAAFAATGAGFPASAGCPPGRPTTAISWQAPAAGAIHHALRGGTGIPGQQRRMRQLAPGTWQQALAVLLGTSPGWQDNGPSQSVVEVAIYPDVIWLAARPLQAQNTRHCAAP